ncbi:MAG TPA: carbohydrate-binding protein [Tepidisphaeraceae bacterium]
MYRANQRHQSSFVSTSNVSIESLEGRQLLSGQTWVPAARLIHQDTAAANFPNLTGAGEAVVVIDSGVDYKHPALGGGMGAGYKVEAGYDFERNDGDPMIDSNAHGTGTAGVIAANPYTYKGLYNQGIAPGVKVIALKESTAAGVKSAMDWVHANRAKYNIVAVNYTFWSGSATLYTNSLKQLIADGIFVSRPSGNAGASNLVGKSVDPADVTVGSVTLSGGMSSFTQRGPELDLLAPGDKVTLPYYDPGSKQHIYVDSAVGTSWSSPAVVGTAALIKQINPAYTPLQILQIMKDSGSPVYDSATKLTYKRLDLNAALTLAYQRKGVAVPQPPLSSGPTPVPPTTTQSPFSGTAIKIAADTTIQAEDFDNGGENVSFHDTDSANLGGSSYRKATAPSVDVQDISGGHIVGFTKAGEWLEYTLNVATAGTYTLSTRVASSGTGGQFHVELDGANKTGTLSVPDTKGWQTYTNVSKSGVALTAGQHVIRVKMDSVGHLGYTGNFDSFRFTLAGATSSGSTSTPAPVAGSRSALTTINANTANGSSGINILNDGIGSLDQGDWAAFNALDFGSAGATKATFTLAVDNAYAGKKIQIRTGSATGAIVGTLTVGGTGSWGKFANQTATLSTKLTGVQTIYLTFSGGSGVANVRAFKFA